MITKKAPKFRCEKCDFNSNNLNHYKRHLDTKKHNMVTNDNKKHQKAHICECGKSYKYSSGLSVHKQKCGLNSINETEILKHKLKEVEEEKQNLQNIIIDTLQNQLKEKDEQIKDLIPKVGNITFNINNFLNDKCKDAISIQEFINSIKISMEDILMTQNYGLSSGITSIIMDNMNKLSLHERPIHCSDKKREVLYVKTDTWEKDVNKKNTKHMITKLCNKQLQSVNLLLDNREDDYLEIFGKCVLDLDEKKVVKNICEHVYVKDL